MSDTTPQPADWPGDTDIEGAAIAHGMIGETPAWLFGCVRDLLAQSPATEASGQPARWLVDIPGTDGVAMRDGVAAQRLAERTEGATVRLLYDAPPGAAPGRGAEPTAGTAWTPERVVALARAHGYPVGGRADYVLTPAEVAVLLREQLAAAERRAERLLCALADARESAQEMATLLARAVGSDYTAQAGAEGDAS